MTYIVVFLIGFIAGGIAMERTRKPNVIANSIKKIKTDEGAVDVTQEIPGNIQVEEIKPKRPGLFKRIFKKKKL